MLNPFLAVVLLGLEANRVIGLRIMKIAEGGEDARSEAFIMVNEKVLAALEASASIFAGKSPAVVINRYREHVAANAKRLAAPSVKLGTYRGNGILLYWRTWWRNHSKVNSQRVGARSGWRL